MAVDHDHSAVKTFDDWYDRREEDHKGCLKYRNLSPQAASIDSMYRRFKSEMDKRVANYDKLEMLADGEVISPKDDLPNISSGETAGIVRRIARNLVQHTPNVEVLSEHDDESEKGIFSRHILLSKIIGSDAYSNDMQQNLFSSVKTAFTLGFDCVIPVLCQDAANGWHVKYDTIHYRDVFPEPGVKDVREAPDVFVRRYLTKGEVMALIRSQPAGWDVAALRALLETSPGTREEQSTAHQDKRHHTIPDGYEIVTWYTSSGEAFLTFDPRSKMLLRIEENRHPLKQHPVHFLVLEKDAQQPLGKSQVELLLGRQEFQDLMLNGAMKMWYRNINPALIAYGSVNALPNLSPGKFTQISNPNAKVEAFSVENQTLLQYGTISQQNLGSMVQLVGAADQQMATQAGSGMSATPQGVEAQQAMVDITTNNYQKAIESFFSHYCSYALTMYFNELSGTQTVTPTADARKQLINAGMKPEAFDESGKLRMNFSELTTEYFVRCIPGSLVEMEDEKQIRLLQDILVPLAQAMPAFAQANDQALMANAAYTIQFIMEKTIEKSGSSDSKELTKRFTQGVTPQLEAALAKSAELETQVSGFGESMLRISEQQDQRMKNMEDMQTQLAEAIGMIAQKMGMQSEGSAAEEDTSAAA